jgi:hypothetical protein
MKCFMGVAQSALRVLLSGDYLIQHGGENTSSTVYLLSIRHHRQLTFKFARLCPGTGQ